jgi:hypothetical protein
LSNHLGRDDQRINRLSSFLYWEGNLEVDKIHPIKQNIYYIDDNYGDKYVLKGHSNQMNMKQQWEFFERSKSRYIVPFVRFPNGKKEITTGTNYYWTISPYVSGRKLNYEVAEDRRKAVKAIQRFHKESNQIFVKNIVKKPLFYKRWNARLHKFMETEPVFRKYGYFSLYEDIVLTMEKYLEIVSNYPWYRDQLNAERNGLWVHGDVASHNFIQNERTFLIDFDLLQCTNQIYDYIQLGQRFLPSLKWDLEKLLSYSMVRDELLERYLYSVFIPSDLLREWLHFLTRKRKLSTVEYLQNMEEEWVSRKVFLSKSNKLLK